MIDRDERSEFKMLTLEDCSVFQTYNEGMKISDMGFTQLYAWQEEFHNHYRIINDYFCAFYQKMDGSASCYAPLGKYEKKRYQDTLLALAEILEKYQLPFRFDFVPENWLSRFENLPGYQASASFHEDFSDYIFQAEDFLCLSGRLNERKRYQINYFKNHCSYEYKSLTDENKNHACHIMDLWCRERACENCYWGCEKRAIYRILENWDRFGCKGAIVYVDGEPRAFMVGEQIDQDMVVSHFQKADRQIKGLYPFLSHMFYQQEYPGISYINLQEDMGIASVRESKLFYRPCHMMRKYTVTLTKR